MRYLLPTLGACSIFTLASAPLPAEPFPQGDYSPNKAASTSFSAFTGKVTKNKVRMRQGASLDAAIVRELNKGELLIVVGETDEFYAVQPPADIKGYIFRTFVLDNKVEGNRVNVRLAPNTEAAVIAQVGSGDPVNGMISPLNSKWLEIAPPTSTRFYVAKEYLDKVGDQHFMGRMARRRDEVNHLLESTYAISQQELQKPFPEIKIEGIIASYQTIVKNYTDFPEQTSRAKELLDQLNGTYLNKKIAYLEAKAENRLPPTSTSPSAPSTGGSTSIATVEPMGFPVIPMPIENQQARIAHWKAVEEAQYEKWSKSNPGTMEDFYADQKRNSVVLKGIIGPYARNVKNKPGDYMLLDPKTKQPLYFLYSTKVDLESKVGQEVEIEAASRPDNHFAYPAYFVLALK